MSGSLRCLHAVRVCNSILASLIRHHRSTAAFRADLARAYAAQSLDTAADLIRSLTAIGIQNHAYRKVLADLKVLDDRASNGAITKSDLTGTIGLSLQRLRSAAKIARTKDLQKELDKFPKPDAEVPVTLTNDYYVLLRGSEPSVEETARHLPVLAQQVQIPVDWLEKAAGIQAIA
jgi:hypothetical protein